MDSPGRYVPSEVDVKNHRAERKVRVKWEDGHDAKYPYEFLRGVCPCASCQGHFQAMKFIYIPGVTLDSIELVGNYAVGVRWTDGHDTGIYTFRKLRDLCPCKSCKPGGVPELLQIGVAQE